MRNLFVYTLIIFLRQTYVIGEKLCGERNVTGAVGGAVTLHVGHTGATIISWSFGERGDPIASIILGGPSEIQDVRYVGRLSSTSDGSLIITKLKQEDRGTYRAQAGTQRCLHHLTVFSNLTAEDITITSNVTGNETCEVTLTCSVNGSDVTTTWRSLNVSDIDGTQNVMFVPPSHINFIYTCTAKNPVSEASKVVHPRDYCWGDNTSKDDQKINRIHLLGLGLAVFIAMIVICVAYIIVKGNKRCSTCGNKDQKPEKEGQKKNMKDQQESPQCSATTVYSQIHHPVEIKPKKSKSMDITNTTLYSTVQHTKDRNGQIISPKASTGEVPKTSAESCYEQVQLPKDRNGQTVSPKASIREVPKISEELCYERVQLPKGTNDRKTSSKGDNGDPSKTQLESCYAQVQLPKENRGQKIPPKPEAAKKPPREAAQSKDKNNQIDPLITINRKPLQIAQKLPDRVVEPSKKPAEPSKDSQSLYDNVQGVEVTSRIQ